MKPQAQRGGFVIGLVVGLLVGLSIALGVALYITKAPVPFMNKVPQRTAEQDNAEAERNKNWDPNAPLGGKTQPQRAAAGAGAASAPPVAAAPALPPPPDAASTAKPGRDPAAILAGSASPAASAPRSTAGGPEAFVYFVQAGAFTRPEDAEQQRAKLAMMGIEAKVSEREQAGRTVLRVRAGPFETRDEADALQVRLTNIAIEARLVRVERP
jgi:cell division protein FtsN